MKFILEKIVKKGSKWQVQSEKGKNMGTYDTKEDAEKRLRQIEYFKHRDNIQEDLQSHYSIYYRWDRIQRSYEIWVEDDREAYPEIYHEWVGNKKDLEFELKELENEYKVKAKRY